MGGIPDAATEDGWDTPPRAAPEEGLVVDLDGYEGPLDLLLTLARAGKIDLARLSMAALAEQYLDFIARARGLTLEVAGDHVVMAAWLAYLKSRLLLPEPPAEDDEPTGEEMAELLAHRLRRLEAMREAAAALMERPLIGRDVFRRVGPPAARGAPSVRHVSTLYELLVAYAAERQKHARLRLELRRRPVWSLADARAALQHVLGPAAGWLPLDAAVAMLKGAVPQRGGERAAGRAAVFSAGLELVREGEAELRQDTDFAPVYLRRRQPAP